MSLTGRVYIVNTVGKLYAKLHGSDRKKYRIEPNQCRTRGRSPKIGDEIRFEPSAHPGADPNSLRVSWWEFMSQETAPALIALDLTQKIDGLTGLHMAFLDLQSCLTADQLRVFCERTPNGEELWRAFRAAQRASANEGYNFRDYANAIING